MTVERASKEDEDLLLLRACEPVVRLTQGEFFMPVGVDEYVRHASLWRVGSQGDMERVTDVGELDLDELARRGRELDGPGYSLSGISVPHSRRDRVRSWFKTERPKFRAGNRLGEVGITGRAIDTLSRTSLLVRGAVPGGSAVASLALQNAYLEPDRPKYHGRVLRDNGWIVCQYWYFYSFNNWRSGFSGVNEHESDWEQVTIFLDGTGLVDDDGLPERAGWFSPLTTRPATTCAVVGRPDSAWSTVIRCCRRRLALGAYSQATTSPVVPPGLEASSRRSDGWRRSTGRAAQGSGPASRASTMPVATERHRARQEYEWTPVVTTTTCRGADYRLWGMTPGQLAVSAVGRSPLRAQRHGAASGDPVGWAGPRRWPPTPAPRWSTSAAGSRTSTRSSRCSTSTRPGRGSFSQSRRQAMPLALPRFAPWRPRSAGSPRRG